MSQVLASGVEWNALPLVLVRLVHQLDEPKRCCIITIIWDFILRIICRAAITLQLYGLLQWMKMPIKSTEVPNLLEK